MAVRCIALLLICAACSRPEPAKHLDLDLVRVSGNARMRTDIVGGGRFTDTATFVLVDAENVADTGAYITLGGSLTDATGSPTGALKPQSLWVPPKQTRTFALVDAARQPRPDSTSAKIEVRGALIAEGPRARVEDFQSFDDHGQVVVNAAVVNPSDRIGRIIVIAAFHERDGRPIARPFSLVELKPRSRSTVQFVGPVGAVRGTIFLGEENY